MTLPVDRVERIERARQRHRPWYAHTTEVIYAYRTRKPGAVYRPSLFANGYGQGGTFGFHVNPGIAFALDWIEPNTAMPPASHR